MIQDDDHDYLWTGDKQSKLATLSVRVQYEIGSGHCENDNSLASKQFIQIVFVLVFDMLLK